MLASRRWRLGALTAASEYVRQALGGLIPPRQCPEAPEIVVGVEQTTNDEGRQAG